MISCSGAIRNIFVSTIGASTYVCEVDVVTGERIAIVGLGRLGCCLLRALERAGACVSAVASNDQQRAEQIVKELQSGTQVTTLAGATAAAELIVLTVPDARIAEVCTSLVVDTRHAVVHTSGALDLTPLLAAGDRGAALGVFHPLQAFPVDAGPERLSGIAIGVDADEPLFGRLCGLAERLGARPFSLRGVDRARYHAAAVFASNCVVALQAVAARIWRSAGLPPADAAFALSALTRGASLALTASSAVEPPAPEPSAGFVRALTGPVVRGDSATVARHVAALQTDRSALDLYQRLTRELLSLPLPISPAQHRALLDALGDPP